MIISSSGQHVRVTKRFTFEMAHALRCHDGMCAQIHGHSYVLDVTLIGTPSNVPGYPKDGMVMDFAELKKLVHTAVIAHYDHALVLHDKDRNSVAEGHELFARVRFTPWQPTCENVLLDIVERLQKVTPVAARLHRVRLQETATSWAEWGAW
ncbi:MAG: 6-carboxytetrahydropterin synthase [Flavobacteriales bacterium]|nr:6-carboxytetrahydropterin synthase [Flavobacteriales bacterium]MBK6943180.1 6-carboxytetrahydropterin synthase [Flavobacteriales bacterium]MBK7240939.1 6-carboxytetrahydropterin synthase [Flavobacteriales bacterium]MBK7296457.1 6-carboxytetrahydropterin synthase [Flavobacteriales bacterium]MBK9536290.1 6-carboxytetrahydropterin synthase [Flavobacteriales bacterium]